MKNHITRRTLLRLGLGGLGWLGATSPLARLGRLQAQRAPRHTVVGGLSFLLTKAHPMKQVPKGCGIAKDVLF